MLKLLAFYLFGILALSFVNGDLITSVKATTGSSATISCNITGRSASNIEWLRHTIGTQRSTIYSNSALAAAYSGVYSVSVSSTSADLVIASVSSSDFNYIFRCRDNSTGSEVQVAILSTTTSICDSTSSIMTVKKVSKGSSVSVDVNTNGAPSASISWYYLRFQQASRIWFNNNFTDSSFSNFVTVSTSGNKTTLTILNVTQSNSVYCFDSSTSPYATDLGYYTVCGGEMVYTSFTILLVGVISAILKISLDF